jgi:tetratricopeptide (TPR) repeat protein
VKGHAPVRAFEVLRPRGRRMRFDMAVERGLTPLVGRERELGLLLGLTKARDRDNAFIVGRLTNTLGWLHQELGDFQRAAEYDRDSADLGQRIGNPNVEISALINLGFDYLHLGEPEKALTLLENTFSRAEQGFGAHHWLWEHLTGH